MATRNCLNLWHQQRQPKAWSSSRLCRLALATDTTLRTLATDRLCDNVAHVCSKIIPINSGTDVKPKDITRHHSTTPDNISHMKFLNSMRDFTCLSSTYNLAQSATTSTYQPRYTIASPTRPACTRVKLGTRLVCHSRRGLYFLVVKRRFITHCHWRYDVQSTILTSWNFCDLDVISPLSLTLVVTSHQLHDSIFIRVNYWHEAIRH